MRSVCKFEERSERLETMSDENVNHPKHYTSHPSGVECIQIVEHMTFNAGNAVKYLWRAGLKGSSPRIEDLKKARWYLDREIQKLESEKNDLGAPERPPRCRRTNKNYCGHPVPCDPGECKHNENESP